MLKYGLLLVFCLPLISSAQEKEKEKKKKNKYDLYWEEQERKEEYQQLFEEGNSLFQQDRYYDAIEQYKKVFALYPNDPQAIAKIRDVEIVLAEGVEQEVDSLTRTFTKLEKLNLSQKEVTLSQPENPKQLQGNRIKEDAVSLPSITEEPAPKESATKEPTQPEKEELKLEYPTTEKAEKVDKSSPEFRQQLAKEYEEGITETTYRKGNRVVTKRVVVKGEYGDEYLKVKHDWGGLYYFKNGQPIKAFIWDKETEALLEESRE